MEAALPRLVIVCGPTASGKTALAIDLAKQLGCTVLSADSRQCYRELNIGVARPSASELAQVPHGFIATHSIQEGVDAAAFARLGHQWIETQHSNGKPVVICGGTGLYLQTLTQGLHQMPPVDENLRQSLTAEYEAKGLSWLQEEVKREDPLWFAQGEILNPARLLRALEVKLGTGRSLVDWWNQPNSAPAYDCLWLGIDLPKDILHERIRLRTEIMLRQGLLAEAERVKTFRQLPALQTVGYKECFAHLDGEIPEEELLPLIALHTRQYAKRQLTWFRRVKEVNWLSGAALEAAAPYLDSVFGQ